MLPPQSIAPRERSLFDPLVSLFAIWTLLSNAVVFSGGSLRTLVWLAFFSALCALGLVVYWKRCAAGADLCSSAEFRVQAPALIWERWFAFLVALYCAGLFLWRGDALVFWSLGLPLSLWCLWRSVAMCEAPEAPHKSHASRLGLWLIALCCMALSLVAHRADVDDAFYVNLAVQAADFPDQVLLAKDGMHGIAGLPFPLAVYRIQSFELLAGAIAWLTPLSALQCMHLLFPALCSLAIPFGLAALLRRLTPRFWLLGVFFGALFLFTAGDPHRSFGNFGFMRLQQGKSVLLNLLLPLTCYYALRYAGRPSWRHFLLLSAVQIAAIGTNVSALWLAPVCAALCLAAGVPAGKKGHRLLLMGLASCAYPLGAGLILSRSTASNLESKGLTVHPVEALPIGILLCLLGVLLVGLVLCYRPNSLRALSGKLTAGLLFLWCLLVGFVPKLSSIDWLSSIGVQRAGLERLNETLAQVLGEGWFAALFMLALLSAWSLAPGSLGRRLWSLFGCVFFLLLWNPLLAENVAGKVTGGPTYWRVFWVLPAAALIGACAASTVRLGFGWHTIPMAARFANASGIGLLLCAALVFFPGQSSLSTKNEVFFAWPGLRARQAELGAAQALVQVAGQGTQVLAPVLVSPWIPTMHQHPYPLMVRRPYMRNLRGYLEKRDIKARSTLTKLVSGPAPVGGQGLQGAGLERLTGGIQVYGLEALCLSSDCVGPDLRTAFAALGLGRVYKNKKYQVWGKL